MIGYLKGNGNFFLPSEKRLKENGCGKPKPFYYYFCSGRGQMRKKESGAFQLHQIFIFPESLFICQRGIVGGLINDFIIAFIGKNG